ncbi:MAG: hypothetical protein ACRC26_09605 [Bacteroidales bacterium]
MSLRTQLFSLFLLFALCFSSSEVCAQSNSIIDEQDLRITVGVAPLSAHLYDFLWGADYCPVIPTLSQIFVYEGAKRTTGAISLGYSNQVMKRLAVGVEATYVGIYQSYYKRFTNERVSSRNQHLLSFSPMCRVTYLNRKYVRLYSQLSLGVGVYLENGSENFRDVTFEGHLTYFGMTFGSKLFGIAELGVGSRGFASFGIGYRFSNK